ncbi:MAG: FkbM family methyltransferase [Rhodospirillaceae bacterium]
MGKHIFSSSDPIQIVGASAIEDKPVYDLLVDQGLARVTGFVPDLEEFERLKDLVSESREYLPDALGDGTEQTLHICQAPGMTSLFESDMDHLSHFHGFENWAKVVDRLPIHTHPLDDITEIENIDFLKVDTQEAEHQIIDNGRDKISEAVALHI